MYKYFKEE